MRYCVALMLCACLAGCAVSRYQVVSVTDTRPGDVILLNTETGETWRREYEKFGDYLYPYWEKLERVRPTTRPQ